MHAGNFNGKNNNFVWLIFFNKKEQLLIKMDKHKTVIITSEQEWTINTIIFIPSFYFNI